MMNNHIAFSEVIISTLKVLFSGVAKQFAIDNAICGEYIFISADDIPNTLTYLTQQINIEDASVDLISMNLKGVQ